MAKIKTYWSPEGVAKFPALVEPDMYKAKPGEKGKFKINLNASAAKLQKLTNFLDSLADKGAAMGTPDGRTYSQLGYATEKDGTVTVKFKTLAGGLTKAGKDWSKTVPIVDENLLPVAEDERNFWSGSTVKILFSAEPFFASSTVYGVSVRLEAVKLIDGVYGGGPDLAGSASFGDDDVADVAGDFGDDDDAGDEDF